MRARQSPVESLVMLPKLPDPGDRSTRFRQAIAALGQDLRVDGPPLLDGVPAEDLVRASQIALATGLVDDLGWIAPGPAAIALYELSSALPPGKERREIARRVFARLYEGDATTFAAVATRMALGSSKPFEIPTLRARIGLVFDLPVGTRVNADPLALVLVSRRELFDRWMAKAATGPLPLRRLAARLFERAAREAVRRDAQGDPHPADLLQSPSVKLVFDRLLADREPLVWRHAASARGILAAVVPSLREDVDLALDPQLSPTEWRRAAVSLVAGISTDLSGGLSQFERFLEGEIVKRDPGLAATLVWGLPAVIEAEPETAQDLLDRLSFAARPDVAEAISALLTDVESRDFGVDAAQRIRTLVLQNAASVDPAMRSIFEDTLRGLNQSRTLGGVHAAVRRALDAYESQGARAAHELAVEALSRAHTTMDALQTLGTEGDISDILGPLGDLDASAVEQSRLHYLLLLGRSPGDTSAQVPELDRLHDRLGAWILEREERQVEGEFSRGEMLARQRTFRTLLHLVDLDSGDGTENEGAKTRLRRALQILVRGLGAGPDASLHRIVCATAARTLDAAARDALADPADLLLVVLDRIGDAHSVQAMMEASTHPDVRDVLRAYAEFLSFGGRARRGSVFDGEVEPGYSDPPGTELDDARSLVELSRGIGTNGSHRGEALRQVVLRMGRALESITVARSLSELVEPPSGEGYPLGDVEHHAESLRRLITGARRRVLEDSEATIEVVADVPRLTALIERAVSGVPPNRAQLSMSINELVAELPAAFAGPLARVLSRIAALPIAPPSDVGVIPLQVRRTSDQLPDWLLPRRTIGAFYVVRALGAGGTSSVFAVRRIEERRAASAELFALKVPQYDPNTARSLSEAEFMQLFREEAGALLSLPAHEHLARFVTFDLAARPKPILVMELIKGFALDRLIRNRSLDTELSFRYLDGILSGLEAMHSVGVGHLDIKPSNVILRNDSTPVLVDFGLSGRHLRPGCGTLEYCAPEVLGVAAPTPATPWAADMYAFACTAFEVLTGELLFDADDEIALMHQHLQHDGWPDKLSTLATVPELANLCVVLAACLRRDPAARPTAPEARRALSQATEWLADEPWPLRAQDAITGQLTA
ncbi:MAG TPA: serine/threonine-protein kinase [Polyangiaceae bacterium]|nr:serine/threonine-protein kinase [Polyangiaceae bacterium]